MWSWGSPTYPPESDCTPSGWLGLTWELTELGGDPWSRRAAPRSPWRWRQLQLRRRDHRLRQEGLRRIANYLSLRGQGRAGLSSLSKQMLSRFACSFRRRYRRRRCNVNRPVWLPWAVHCNPVRSSRFFHTATGCLTIFQKSSLAFLKGFKSNFYLFQEFAFFKEFLPTFRQFLERGIIFRLIVFF